MRLAALAGLGAWGRLNDWRLPQAKLLKTEKRDGYALEHLELDLNGIEPVPAYLLLPEKRADKAPGLLYICGSFQSQNRPVMMKSRLPQAKIRIDSRRMADDRKHRQIAHAVRISERVAEIDSFTLGKCSNP